jgi:hypothetical protein
LGQEDEFYEITTNVKNKFKEKEKTAIVLILKNIKRKVLIIALALRINYH